MLVQLNNVMCSGDQINITKQANQHCADFFSLVNEEAVQKEILDSLNCIDKTLKPLPKAGTTFLMQILPTKWAKSAN